MIRVASISRINLSSGRTNVYNFVKTCEALNARKDFHVTLVTTDQDRDREAFARAVGIHQPFEIVCLGVTNTLSKYSGSRVHELFMLLTSNLHLALFLFKCSKEFDIIYFRDESLFLVAWFGKLILQKRFFFEVHSVLQGRLRQLMNVAAVRYADGVIAISGGLKRYYQRKNDAIVLSLCSAAEESWFDYSKEKSSFRKELDLPVDAFLIGYTGVVGANPNNDYYEVDDIVRSLPSLPENVVLVIVGELHANARWLRDIAKDCKVEGRVIVVPWQKRNVIPKYLQAFDVILVPKRKKDLIGDSPAKMFPALAARRPIIAGRAESIEEVLTDDRDAIIVEENSLQGWADAVLKVYRDQELAEKLSNNAWDTHHNYTWERRGTVIAEFIRERKFV